MSGQRAARGRSTREWSIRALLAAVALVAGYVGLRQTLGYVVRGGDAARAHAIAPGDGRITALLATALSEPGASAADRARADGLARTALIQDPTAVGAAAVLALDAGLRGDAATARHFLGYAQTLSRRDLASQLLAIEDAVARSDVPGALRHHDIALRTSRQAPDLLFPVLSGASGDPAVRAELARTLAQKPAWGGAFVDYLSMNAADPVASADLFRQLARVGFPVSQGARAAVLKALLANDRLEEAWRYYASLQPGVDRRRSRDERFVRTDAATPFDWTLREDGVNASIQRGESGGVFDFSAPGSVGGVVLEQMQMLPPGAYRLEGHSLGVDEPAGSRPYWSLRCRGGEELGRVEVPASAQAGGVFAGTYTVPVGCPVQTLALAVRPSEDMAGTSGQIDRVRLYPLGAR